MDHIVLPADNTMHAFPSWAFTRCHYHSNWGSGHPIAAYYSFIDPERMKGWVGLVGWPINGHPSATGRAQDSERTPAKDRRLYRLLKSHNAKTTWASQRVCKLQ